MDKKSFESPSTKNNFRKNISEYLSKSLAILDSCTPNRRLLSKRYGVTHNSDDENAIED